MEAEAHAAHVAYSFAYSSWPKMPSPTPPFPISRLAQRLASPMDNFRWATAPFILRDPHASLPAASPTTDAGLDLVEATDRTVILRLTEEGGH
eukprot:scaffold95038_cov16-Prasinocladus_malaysianus.AAC.3